MVSSELRRLRKSMIRQPDGRQGWCMRLIFYWRTLLLPRFADDVEEGFFHAGVEEGFVLIKDTLLLEEC